MIRVSIRFTDAQHRALKRRAREESISVAEAVRRCVDERLTTDRITPSRAKLVRDALSVMGKYADREGARNVGRDHDHYLAEAYQK